MKTKIMIIVLGTLISTSIMAQKEGGVWDRYYAENPKEAPASWKAKHDSTYVPPEKGIKSDGQDLKSFGCALAGVGTGSLGVGVIMHFMYINLDEITEQDIKTDKTAQYLMGTGALTSLIGIYCIISGNQKIMNSKIKIQSTSNGVKLTYKF